LTRNGLPTDEDFWGSAYHERQEQSWVAVQSLPPGAYLDGGAYSEERLQMVGASLAAGSKVRALEPLSYEPVKYDHSTTFDMERSHARYSNNVVHSTRARTQTRLEAWDDFFQAATLGRRVTLMGVQNNMSDPMQAHVVQRPAVLTIDKSLTTISIVPESNGNFAEGLEESILEKGTMFHIDRIQLICPATDAKLLHDVLARRLTEDEKPRAVVLEYTELSSSADFGPPPSRAHGGGSGGQRQRVFLLEESKADKDVFVNALTSLWLEKRNDHSMWF
jgi:hypothetical protein